MGPMTEEDWPQVGTVPAAFDSAAHGPVGLHVMHLSLD